MTRSASFVVVLLLALGLFAAPSCAQIVPAQSASAQSTLFNRNAVPPDVNSIPILNGIVHNGAKLYYMGERSGLHGWFIVKDGQIQMIYVTSDKKTAIIGAVFTAEGDNVTSPQIEALAASNAEVSGIINGPARQQEEIIRAGAIPGGAASVPSSVPANAQNAAAPAAKDAVPMVALSPGDRLYQDLKAAAGVRAGTNETSEILMIVSPTCPHCKATWRALRDYVKNGSVSVKLIPVTNDPKKDETRAAAQLLKAANPVETWDKYVEGDASALGGEADPIQLKAVLANTELLLKWNIQATPYLVYRSKDGRVKIVQGEPQRMPAVLSDLMK